MPIPNSVGSQSEAKAPDAPEAATVGPETPADNTNNDTSSSSAGDAPAPSDPPSDVPSAPAAETPAAPPSATKTDSSSADSTPAPAEPAEPAEPAPEPAAAAAPEPAPEPTGTPAAIPPPSDVFAAVEELVYGPSRENALMQLGKKRELYPDLALVLWHAHGVMTVLLQEIVSVYPMLSPPQLTVLTSNRVSNALQLLQCVASHRSTHLPFLNSHVLLYLYPFLNTTSSARPYEYLRLTSLGVIGALVKNENTQVVTFLLSTEIIPLCLRIIETTSGISKTVALFIVLRILQDPQGLIYVCQTYERFYAVNQVLTIVVEQLVQQPQDSSIRLLKHVIMCYARLADDDRARHSLREILPEALRNGTFTQTLREDQSTKRLLNQLIVTINKE